MSEQRIRLGCLYCDTDEADGVSKIPEGWQEVEESIANDLPLDWETHVGVCPECAVWACAVPAPDPEEMEE